MKVARKESKSRHIVFGIIGCVIAIAFAGMLFYPLYVRYVAGIYAKEFATVLNSHDRKRYDDFFEEDTVFKYGEKEISYADAREYILQIQDFASGDSYGHLEEHAQIFGTKEYKVSLMLPVSTAEGGYSGIAEGWFMLRRKNVLFFEIKEVGFYDVGNG